MYPSPVSASAIQYPIPPLHSVSGSCGNGPVYHSLAFAIFYDYLIPHPQPLPSPPLPILPYPRIKREDKKETYMINLLMRCPAVILQNIEVLTSRRLSNLLRNL